MLQPNDPDAQLALVTGQRVTAEQTAGAIRQNLENWKAEDAKAGTVLRAIRWGRDEVWAARVEGLMKAVAQHADALKQLEQTITQAAAAAAPSQAKPARKPRKPAKRARGR